MKPIRYRWVCTVDEPGVQACTSCGVNAYATAREFMPPSPGRPKSVDSPTSVISDSLMTFVPEIGVAAVIVLCAPVWFLVLLFRGNFVAAFVLLGGVGASTYGFFVALQERSTLFAYVAMMSVLFSGFLAYRCS